MGNVVVDNINRGLFAVGGRNVPTASGNEVDVTFIDTVMENNGMNRGGQDILAFGALDGGANNTVRLHFNRVGGDDPVLLLLFDNFGVSGSGNSVEVTGNTTSIEQVNPSELVSIIIPLSEFTIGQND